MKELDPRSDYDLNKEYNMLQKEKEDQIYDEVICNTLQAQQDEIMSVLMDRKMADYEDEDDIGCSNISI